MPPKRKSAAKATPAVQDGKDDKSDRSAKKSDAAAKPESDAAVREQEPEQLDPSKVVQAPPGDPTTSKKERTETTTAKKRKAPASHGDENQTDTKTSRRSGRASSKPTQLQLLQFLLSPACLELCQPPDETEALQSDKSLKTYSSSPLNPFEELLSALILSRPISHRLGHRSIRVLLNPPYSFNTAPAIQSAGEDKVRQSLWDARTQHKEKTTQQILNLADVILDKYAHAKESGARTGALLKGLEDHGNDGFALVDSLKKDVKGFGKTGGEIFLRRVQWLEGWEQEVFPFVDAKTGDALRELGIESQGLDEVIAQAANWKVLGKSAEVAGANDAERKRRAFVVVLERATSAALEGRLNAVLDEAAKAAS